ncbi:MAG TPA: LysM peptidoglycan-binding domain-containing protein, partial [Candidatus Levybacteria bacterium]|nr:LysM peptidoglycan-binding domain-containing protein [Candidatus Levybacteria bacterium]
DPPDVGSDGVYFTASMSSDGQTILVGTFDEGTLYLSTDGGDTWSVTNGTHTHIVWGTSAMSDNGQIMIAAVGSFGQGPVYLSTDSGSSWTRVLPDDTTNHDWKWLAMSDNGATIVIAGNSGVFYSKDTGSTWSQTDPVGSSTPTWGTVGVSSDATKNLAAANGGRVYLSGVLPNIITPTPTPTSIPIYSASGNSSSAQSCSDASPKNTPDLFQIDAGRTQVTLYFTPVDHANKYYISYGNGTATSGYGIEFGQGETHGVLSYTINSLNSNSQYTFIVRGGNGCMPGDWGNSMTIKTTSGKTGGISYYKSFISRILSIFPKDISQVSGNQGVEVSYTDVITCHDYIVKPGDSLWSIASSILGSGSKYHSIMITNQLSNSFLHIGQKIKVGC